MSNKENVERKYRYKTGDSLFLIILLHTLLLIFAYFIFKSQDLNTFRICIYVILIFLFLFNHLYVNVLFLFENEIQIRYPLRVFKRSFKIQINEIQKIIIQSDENRAGGIKLIIYNKNGSVMRFFIFHEGDFQEFVDFLKKYGVQVIVKANWLK